MQIGNGAESEATTSVARPEAVVDIRKLSDADEHVRLDALEQLVKIFKSPPLCETSLVAVIKALADRSQTVRDSAARALAVSFEHAKSQPMVLKFLTEHGLRHTKWQNRLHTLLALQFIDIDKLVVLQSLLEEGIGPCLQDSQELVIQAAKQTLTHWETKDLTKDVSKKHEKHEKAEFDENSNVVFGCVPADVIKRLESPNWQIRSIALEEFHQYLTSVTVPLPQVVKNSVREVLEQLSSLLADNNFKVTLTTLYVIGDLIDLWGDNVIPVVGAILQGLFEKLGDNKIVIRQTSIKVFFKIFQKTVSLQKADVPVKKNTSCDMSAYVPRLLGSICTASKESTCSLRSSELISVIIMAVHVLHQSRCPYDTKMVAQALMDIARDSKKEKVNQVAMKALAFLQARLGPVRIPELAELLNSRVDKGPESGMPVVNDEGIVEYVNIGYRVSPTKRPPTRSSDNDKEWSPLQALPEDMEDVWAQPFTASRLRSSVLSQDPDDAWVERPYTAANNSVCGASDKSREQSSRLTVSTVSSSRHRPSMGSLRSHSPSSSSEAQTECRRSSLSSSSKKGRGGSSAPLRVNFGNEEVLSPLSEALSSSKSTSHQTMDVSNSYSALSSDMMIGGACSSSLTSNNSGSQSHIPSRRASRDANTPYVPSGMQRPATRQVSKREGRREGILKDRGSGLQSGFWQQFPCSGDKSQSLAPKFCPSHCDEIKENGFRDKWNDICKNNDWEDKGTIISEESISPNRCPEWTFDKWDAPDAKVDDTFDKWDAQVTKLDDTFDKWDALGSMPGGKKFNEDDVALFHKSEATRRMLESMSPCTPDIPNNITDKLRLLKSSSRASSRSNCRSSYCGKDKCRLEVVSPTTEDFVGHEDLDGPRRMHLANGNGRFFAKDESRRGARRNTLGLTVRQESADFLDFHRGTDEARELLHSAPLPNTCARNQTNGQRNRMPSRAGYSGSRGGEGVGVVVGSPASQRFAGQRTKLKKNKETLPNPNAAAQYTTCENLTPFKRPVNEFFTKDIIRRLDAGKEWMQQFEALDDLRRFAKFGRSSKPGGEHMKDDYALFQQAFPLVVQMCESPRSALARNAIICLHDLYSLLPPKCMDASIDIAMPMLLRKSVDTNGFVCDEALLSLRRISATSSIQKLISSALAHQSAAKIAAARAKGLLVLSWILLRINDIEELMRYKDASRIFILIATSLEDAAVDVRQVARLGIQCLRDISNTDNKDEDCGVLHPSIATAVQQHSRELFNKMRQSSQRPRIKVPLW